jgi:hypothetical protein
MSRDESVKVGLGHGDLPIECTILIAFQRALEGVLAVREYDYLSSSVSFGGIPESLTGLTQPVASVDGWRELVDFPCIRVVPLRLSCDS